MQFAPLPSYIVILRLNIFLSTLLSNTISLSSSLNVSDQVSLPCKTTGKIIVLYIFIFKFLDSKLQDKDSAPNDSKHSLTKNSLNFFLNRILICQVRPKYIKFSTVP